MSDIHGELDKYQKMLETIQFQPSDTLYILGDVIDRNPGGIDIIRDIMSKENIVLLRGNHEQMCLDTLWNRDPPLGARKLWLSNGGGDTRRELLYVISAKEKHAILRFLNETPLMANVEVKGRKFTLVHAAPMQKADDCLWLRPEEVPWKEVPENVTCVIGHTPVCFLYTTQPSEPMKIFHSEGFVDIDCGCGNKTELRRLACLRLDDMVEFYT